jgi:hypothetical protein
MSPIRRASGHRWKPIASGTRDAARSGPAQSSISVPEVGDRDLHRVAGCARDCSMIPFSTSRARVPVESSPSVASATPGGAPSSRQSVSRTSLGGRSVRFRAAACSSSGSFGARGAPGRGTGRGGRGSCDHPGPHLTTCEGPRLENSRGTGSDCRRSRDSRRRAQHSAAGGGVPVAPPRPARLSPRGRPASPCSSATRSAASTRAVVAAW